MKLGSPVYEELFIIALELIKSCLSNGTQMVMVEGIMSNPLPICHGVPQGLILGPWLFNVYVNDLSHYLDGHLVQYADDTTMNDDDYSLIH